MESDAAVPWWHQSPAWHRDADRTRCAARQWVACPTGARQRSQALSVGTPTNGGRVALIIDGTAQPFVPGGEFAIAGDAVGTLMIGRDLGGKRYIRLLTLTLSQRPTSETPVNDAAVQLTARMRDMEQMSYRVVSVPAGAGNYRLSLWVPMLGEWQVDVETHIPGMAVQTLQRELTLLSE